jgi:steroid delta-isomerase-like uncharacterized protein
MDYCCVSKLVRLFTRSIQKRGDKMSVQDNLKLDEEEIAAWNAHDVERAVAIFPDDVKWQDVGSPQPFNGKDAIRQYLQGWFSAFPDIKITVTNRVITEDYVAAEIDFVGTNNGALQMAPGAPAIPTTGRKVNGKGTYFVHFKNGKPVEVRMEVRSYPDAAGMLMQLGMMPMPGA